VLEARREVSRALNRHRRRSAIQVSDADLDPGRKCSRRDHGSEVTELNGLPTGAFIDEHVRIADQVDPRLELSDPFLLCEAIRCLLVPKGTTTV